MGHQTNVYLLGLCTYWDLYLVGLYLVGIIRGGTVYLVRGTLYNMSYINADKSAFGNIMHPQ